MAGFELVANKPGNTEKNSAGSSLRNFYLIFSKVIIDEFEETKSSFRFLNFAQPSSKLKKGSLSSDFAVEDIC